MLHSENLNNFIDDLKDKQFSEQVEKRIDITISGSSLTREEELLARALISIHGSGTLTRKSGEGGVELRLADPRLLETSGDREFTSRHLYINLTKVVGGWENAARCVNDGHVYNIRELLSYKPLEARMERIPESIKKRRANVADYTDLLEEDENGNLVPPRAGEGIPLDELEPDHPAIQYLKERNVTPTSLKEQFGAFYCTKCNPKLEKARAIARLGGPITSTPEGRIIFPFNQFGVARGWQSRRIEKFVGEFLFYWFGEAWHKVGKRAPDGSLVPLPPYDSGKKRIFSCKYVIGPGAKKEAVLVGIDAAREWNRKHDSQVVGICEGVFDAARLGPPFCAMLGASILHQQLRLVQNFFRRCIFVPDNPHEGDKQSQELYEKAISDFQPLKAAGLGLDIMHIPRPHKDAGDLPDDLVRKLRKEHHLP